MPGRTPPATPDGLPLLLGRLHRHPGADGLGYLTVRVRCEVCGEHHTHTWAEAGLSGVGRRAPHCRDGTPDRPAWYWIALDPAHDAEGRRVLKRFNIIGDA